jgi:3-(3-hydroxy-phenyl)propionate hydroxylase
VPFEPAERGTVAVIGGGPVGLTAANLLAEYGVRVTVLERNSTTSNDAKAISLDGESIRTIQIAGLADAVRAIVVPGTGTRYLGARGQQLFHAGGAAAFGYPVKNQFAQPELERLLLGAALARPEVSVRFDTEMTGLTEVDDGVAVTSNSAGRPTTDTYDYVLACDGGRSTARALLGIEMTGTSHDERWLVADVTNDPHRERYGMHHGDPGRPRVVIPGRGGRCRYEFRLRPGEAAPGGDVPFALVRSLVSPYRPLVPGEIERAVVYSFNSVVADRWRAGRVFLLGDAAHMMPPFAGQGLNSGIRDAVNLCWKIAAVDRGLAGDRLLDSYQTERRPHAEATVELSARLGRIVMTTDRRRAFVRDEAVRVLMWYPPARRYLTQMRYRPPSRIWSGFAVQEGNLPLLGAVLEQPKVLLGDGYSVDLLDNALGKGFAVLGVSVTSSDWQAAAALSKMLDARELDVCLGDRLPETRAGRTAIGDLDGHLERLLDRYQRSFVVVRPDRYVCAIVAPTDVGRVARALQYLLSGPEASAHAPHRAAGTRR